MICDTSKFIFSPVWSDLLFQDSFEIPTWSRPLRVLLWLTLMNVENSITRLGMYHAKGLDRLLIRV